MICDALCDLVPFVQFKKRKNERRLDLFPAGTTARDPHHRESPTSYEQDLNLRIS